MEGIAPLQETPSHPRTIRTTRRFQGQTSAGTVADTSEGFSQYNNKRSRTRVQSTQDKSRRKSAQKNPEVPPGTRGHTLLLEASEPGGGVSRATSSERWQSEANNFVDDTYRNKGGSIQPRELDEGPPGPLTKRHFHSDHIVLYLPHASHLPPKGPLCIAERLIRRSSGDRGDAPSPSGAFRCLLRLAGRLDLLRAAVVAVDAISRRSLNSSPTFSHFTPFCRTRQLFAGFASPESGGGAAPWRQTGCVTCCNRTEQHGATSIGQHRHASQSFSRLFPSPLSHLRFPPLLYFPPLPRFFDEGVIFFHGL